MTSYKPSSPLGVYKLLILPIFCYILDTMVKPKERNDTTYRTRLDNKPEKERAYPCQKYYFPNMEGWPLHEGDIL